MRKLRAQQFTMFSSRDESRNAYVGQAARFMVALPMQTTSSRSRYWLALAQLITAILGLLGLATSPGIETGLIWLILAAAAITALMLATIFGPPSLRKGGRRFFIFVCENFVVSCGAQGAHRFPRCAALARWKLEIGNHAAQWKLFR